MQSIFSIFSPLITGAPTCNIYTSQVSCDNLKKSDEGKVVCYQSDNENWNAINQNKNKINAFENDNRSSNTLLTNQKKMLFEKDTTIFQMSENSSLAEMKVDLMITVIRAEIKFMNLLFEDSKSMNSWMRSFKRVNKRNKE